jgi:hypothetical protein
MAINTQGLQLLLKVTANTAEEELTCEESGELVHRYVEFRVSGRTDFPPDLAMVHQHLTVCPECLEVVEAIIESVKAERGQPIGG